MKRIFLTIILFVTIIPFVYSQAFNGGIIAGLSATQLDGDNWGGYHKAGLCFGVFTNTQLNRYVDAQLELRYVQKGSNSNSEASQVFYVSKLNYLEMPIYLKYNFLNKFSANIGVSAGYLQNATEDKDGIGDEPADPEFNPFEFSGLAGVEYQIVDRLYFNIRFNYSILAVRHHPGDQTFFLNKGQYNNALTFTIHYQINKTDERRRKKPCDCPKRSKRFNIH